MPGPLIGVRQHIYSRSKTQKGIVGSGWGYLTYPRVFGYGYPFFEKVSGNRPFLNNWNLIHQHRSGRYQYFHAPQTTYWYPQFSSYDMWRANTQAAGLPVTIATMNGYIWEYDLPAWKGLARHSISIFLVPHIHLSSGHSGHIEYHFRDLFSIQFSRKRSRK